MQRQLKRIKTFTIEEVEAIVKEAVINSSCNRLEKKADGFGTVIDGYDVYKRSLRYKTFIEKGYKCVCCGRVGAYYALECDEVANPNRAHFNLYSDDDVLMTKDHILPKSKGGKDAIENMQTMCTICNGSKGNKVPQDCVSDLKQLKKVDNREYFWCGDKKYIGLHKAASVIAKGNKAAIPKIKKKIRDSVKNGTMYCGVVWRYGKELNNEDGADARKTV